MRKERLIHEWWAGESTSQQITASFANRVAADGGVTEAQSCLNSRVETLKTLGFYDKASLILTPNGYKEGKIYAVKPTSGAGDFSFTRSTTATRKGSSIIESVPYNLFFNSSTLQTTWSFAGLSGTVTADQAIAPDGTLTADRVQLASGGVSTLRQTITPVTGATYTISGYIKSASGNNESFRLLGSGSNFSANLVANTTWQRFSHTFVAGGSGTHGISNDDVSNAADLYVWGMQLVIGSLSLDLLQTTTRFNVPRLDYNISCPSILLEPQRTNLLLRSEEFDNATWIKSGATVTINTTVAPDGLSTADAIFEEAVVNDHYVVQSVAKALSAIQYTLSAYIKPNGRDWCFLRVASGVNGYRVWFNVTTGAIGTSSIVGAGFTLQSSQITQASNGFYRCEIVFTSDATSTVSCYLNAATADNVTSYAGDITKGLYVWGAQLEAGAYASSYIPTTSAQATRVTDTITALTASDLIGQTEGTILIRVKTAGDSASKRVISISDGTANNVIVLIISGTNTIQATVTASAVATANISSAAFTTSVYRNIAFVYRNNYAALFIDGVKVGEDISVTIPAPMPRVGFDRFDSNTAALLYGELQLAALSKTAISDAEAIALTTP